MHFMPSHKMLVLLAATSLVAFGQRGTGGGRGGAINSGRQTNVIRYPGPNTGGRPVAVRSDIAPPTGLIPPAAAYTGISPGGLKTIGRPSRYPFVPIFAPPLYYPGAYGSPFSPGVASYNDPAINPANDSTLLANQDAMAHEIKMLSAQLEEMRSTPAQPVAVSDIPPVAPPVAATDSPTEQMPVQIVLRNGQQYSVKSFAVMNGVLWDFSASRARKIALSSIDIAASSRATEASGGEFPVSIKN